MTSTQLAGLQPPQSSSSPLLASALQSMVQCAPIGLAAFDADGGLVMLNPAAQRMLGHDGVPANQTCADRLGLHGSRLEHMHRVQLDNLVLGHAEGPVRFQTTDGLPLTAARHRGEDGNAILSFTCAKPDAPAPARRDTLTGLADRQTFLDRLAILCERAASPVAVLFIDLDRFKAVNDALGHPAGDALLKLVAQRLRGMLRKADIVCRLGGDEFAVAIEISPELPDITNRLVSILSRPYLVERQSAVIGASIGVAYGPQHGTTADALLRAADIALYRAKADGRGRVRIFDQELAELSRTRYALADDLRRAIPLQQLEVHYQPQVCLETRKINGFEALLRWNHPQRGRISPDQFIPLAEESGLILAFGEWVLHEACRQATSWPDHITIAVNVSPLQLLDRDRLPRAIAAILASTGLSPRRLEIEITETALVREAEALVVLNAIRATGVRVSMDDFGTGYSSLSQLRRFPFDKLKIDRSFIRDLGGSEEAAAVVRAIAALGKSLGMVTIAEGVETSEQAAHCHADGCSSMQGYLVSRPIPSGAVNALIQSLS